MSLRGWPIVLLAVLIASSWALGLRWLTPRSVEGLAAHEEAIRQRVVREIVDRLPVNVLERYFQELGLERRRLDGFGLLRWDGLDVVVAVGEPPDPASFWGPALAEVARTGARLVWIPADWRRVSLPALGLEFEKEDSEIVLARPAHPLPLLAGVGSIELRGAGRLTQVGSRVLRLLEDDRHGVYAVLVPVGRGEVVVLDAPEIASLEGLRRADNALLLAALARRDRAPNPAVGMIRPGETAREQLVTAIATALESDRREARRILREAPLLSLWSLVKANPSCLVLVQLLLAVLVHLLGSGRDLPAPARPALLAADGRVLDGLAALYRTAPWGARVLLPVAQSVFRLRLRRALRAGLGADQSDLRARLEKRSPELAARFLGVSIEVQAELTSAGPITPEAFARLIGSMQDLAREVET